MTYSDIKLVPSHALTELGWHAERMIELRASEGDEFVCKQFEVEYVDGRIRQGAGILLKETSCAWVLQGFMIYTIVAEKKMANICQQLTRVKTNNFILKRKV